MRPLFSNTKTKIWLWISITGAGFIIALLGLILSNFLNLEAVYGWSMYAVGMTLLVIFGIISLFTVYKDAREYSLVLNERIKLIENTYGIPVSVEEYLELEYPLKAPDRNTFSSYGTIFLSKRNSEKTEVTLMWNGSELQLTSTVPGSTEHKELARVTDN